MALRKKRRVSDNMCGTDLRSPERRCLWYGCEPFFLCRNTRSPMRQISDTHRLGVNVAIGSVPLYCHHVYVKLRETKRGREIQMTVCENNKRMREGLTMSERDSVSSSGTIEVLWIKNLSWHLAASGGSSFMAIRKTRVSPPHNV